MEDDTMEFLCECDSFICKKKIRLSTNDYGEIMKGGKKCIIVDGCETPISKGDTLLEKKEGYSVYAIGDE